MTNRSLTQNKIKAVQSRPGNEAIGRATLGEFVKTARKTIKPQEEILKAGWNAFSQKATSGGSSKPGELLEHARTALLETGALTQMREVARASSAVLETTEGAVPLDSMTVGFKTSLAPWNNVLKEFSLPLIKASFSLFANFFGPEGNAARLCLSAAVVTDSTYGVHSRWEFGGINIFAGPAKWDNVPGWNFGAGGGIDDTAYFDVADFGWKWTLAAEPETLCFFFDICVIDSEGLHQPVSSHLQTQAEVVSSLESSQIPIHGSTWVEHVWCSPDWTNTPLVIEDSAAEAAAASALESVVADPNNDLGAEDWDPETEAV